MLELCKTILQKVSFDKLLFRNELRKALKWLSREEALMLKTWCLINFGSNYQSIIYEVYDTMA